MFFQIESQAEVDILLWSQTMVNTNQFLFQITIREPLEMFVPNSGYDGNPDEYKCKCNAVYLIKLGMLTSALVYKLWCWVIISDFYSRIIYCFAVRNK